MSRGGSKLGTTPICSPKMCPQNFSHSCAEEVGKFRGQTRDPTRFHKRHYGPIQPTNLVIYKHFPAKNVRSHLKFTLSSAAAWVHLNAIAKLLWVCPQPSLQQAEKHPRQNAEYWSKLADPNKMTGLTKEETNEKEVHRKHLMGSQKNPSYKGTSTVLTPLWECPIPQVLLFSCWKQHLPLLFLANSCKQAWETPEVEQHLLISLRACRLKCSHLLEKKRKTKQILNQLS